MTLAGEQDAVLIKRPLVAVVKTCIDKGHAIQSEEVKETIDEEAEKYCI
jgi:hypothetical protein